MGCVGCQRHSIGRFIHGKETRYPLCRKLGGPQGRTGRVRKFSPITGIRSPDLPARSESLYQLSYPGILIKISVRGDSGSHAFDVWPPYFREYAVRVRWCVWGLLLVFGCHWILNDVNLPARRLIPICAAWFSIEKSLHRVHVVYLTVPMILSSFSVEQQLHVGPRPPHCWGLWITPNQTHPVGVPSTSDGLVAETATCTTHNKKKRRTSLSSVEFEPAIPGIERLHTYATNGDHLLEHH